MGLSVRARVQVLRKAVLAFLVSAIEVLYWSNVLGVLEMGSSSS